MHRGGDGAAVDAELRQEDRDSSRNGAVSGNRSCGVCKSLRDAETMIAGGERVALWFLSVRRRDEAAREGVH